jgi:endo-1,4-beta-xylanase
MVPGLSPLFADFAGVRVLFRTMQHHFLTRLVSSSLLALMQICAYGLDRSLVPPSVPLWPGTAPGSEGKTSPEIVFIRHEPATADTLDVSFPVVSNINFPSLTPFLPAKDKATGAAVIVLPGGGFQFLPVDHEGYDLAKYLADHGIAAFVLKYRLARAPGSTYKVEVEGLMDTQRAIRLVRARAAEWGVDPHRVGVLGFSAGGQLCLLASTQYDKPVAGSNDDVDKLDCRPDFQALIYPGGLNNPDRVPVTKDTPPSFLACTYTDRLTISKNLAAFYLILKTAGVPAELHIYGSGGHGFGVRPTTRPSSTWPDRFVDWMRDRGYLGNN